MTEIQLQQLIEGICNNPEPTSSERQWAIHRLLFELQQLPGLKKSSHPYYLEALDRTWEWVCNDNICKFQPRSHLSLQESLANWINGYLYWRIKDLYLKQARLYDKEISFDAEMYKNDYGKTVSWGDILSETGLQPPSLSGLDAYIQTLRDQNNQESVQHFKHYIEEDPEQTLKKLHLRKCPECNCQLLAKKLLLKNPPERLSGIHREFKNSGIEIPDQTLRSHWKNKCQPCLQQILQNFGYSKD